MPIPS